MDALKAVGAEVLKVGGTGNPDLVVGYGGRWTPLEVKTGKGKRTRNQQAITWAVVTTPEEALIAVGATQ